MPESPRVCACSIISSGWEAPRRNEKEERAESSTNPDISHTALANRFCLSRERAAEQSADSERRVPSQDLSRGVSPQNPARDLGTPAPRAHCLQAGPPGAQST